MLVNHPQFISSINYLEDCRAFQVSLCVDYVALCSSSLRRSKFILCSQASIASVSNSIPPQMIVLFGPSIFLFLMGIPNHSQLARIIF